MGELKTSKSGEEEDLGLLNGKSTHNIMFTMTGKHDLHLNDDTGALSDDHDLSSLIAGANIQNAGGLKS